MSIDDDVSGDVAACIFRVTGADSLVCHDKGISEINPEVL